MTDTDRDPFERLAHIAAPEPDPRKMEAAIAASTRAFSSQLAQPSARAARKRNWFSNWFPGVHWTVPAGAGLAACVALVGLSVVIQPGTMDTSGPADSVLSRSAEVAPPPAAPSSQIEAEPLPTDEFPRMGAMPGPQDRQGLPLDMRDDVVAERLEFGDLELTVRSAPDQVGMYLVENNVEQQFDLRMKEPDQTITVTDAFLHETGAGASLLLVRSGYSDEGQQWEAFVENGWDYVLSGALTLDIQDAASRDEVIERLEAE